MHEAPWPLVVECDNHGRDPYAFVCPHLHMLPSQDWYALVLDQDDAREVACAGHPAPASGCPRRFRRRLMRVHWARFGDSTAWTLNLRSWQWVAATT